MSEWESYVDSLVGAGWTVDQVASDLESRGWPHADAVAFTRERMPVAVPAPPPPPPPWAQPAAQPVAQPAAQPAAPGWGEPDYNSPGWADPVPLAAATPLASSPQLSSFPTSEQLRRSSERTELVIRILAAVCVAGVVAGVLAFHLTDLGDDIVGSRLALMAIPFGLATLFAAVVEADWFFDRVWIQMMVKLFGRNLVRAAYVVGGCWSVLAGLTYGLAPTGGF